MTKIADTIRRLEDAVERRPGFGVVTSRSETTLRDGLRCVSSDGDWTIDTDLPVALGGTASAPSPSVLLRAALGACTAMSYRLRAERAGLGPIDVTVTVDADSVLAGMLNPTATSPPGFTGVRFAVDVGCDAPPDEIRRILDEGDLLSPVLDAIRRPTSATRSTTIRTLGS